MVPGLDGTGKIKTEEAEKMTFSVYTDGEGCIGEVSAPSREVAAEFLAQEGYEPGTYELREANN